MADHNYNEIFVKLNEQIISQQEKSNYDINKAVSTSNEIRLLQEFIDSYTVNEPYSTFTRI